MKKVFALTLALLLFAAALPAAAESPVTVTLICNGKAETLPAGEGVTLPVPDTGDKVFAGWLWEKDGTPALYPAGAVICPETDATLTALAVGMQTLTPELRVIAADDMGLRFLTEINAADFAALCAVTEVQTGTIIAPKYFAQKKAGGVLTPESIAKNGKSLFVDVPAGGFYRKSAETHTVAGSLTGIAGKNSTMDFLGVGYLSLTFADGTTGRIYAPTNLSHAAKYYSALCAHEGTAESGKETEWVRAALAGVLEVEWESPQKYGILRGGKLFEMTYEKRTADDGIFTITIKNGVDFRFDRDLYALVSNGAAMKQGSFYTVGEGGKTLSFKYSAYTENY